MICMICKQDLPAGNFYWRASGRIVNQKCKSCYKEFYTGSKEKKLQRKNRRLKRVYGIDLQQYQTLFNEQFGLCACCRLESKLTLHVDHDHATGKIRGLLCYNCNIAIGYLREDLNRIYKVIDYLGLHKVFENSES